MGGGRAYGNVSTTPNGSVNGTNRSGNVHGYVHDAYGNAGYDWNSNPDGYSYNSGSAGSANSGTGMTGGR